MTQRSKFGWTRRMSSGMLLHKLINWIGLTNIVFLFLVLNIAEMLVACNFNWIKSPRLSKLFLAKLSNCLGVLLFTELCQCRHCAEQVHKANASVLCVSFLVDGSLLNKPSSKCRFSPNVRRLTTTFGKWIYVLLITCLYFAIRLNSLLPCVL